MTAREFYETKYIIGREDPPDMFKFAETYNAYQEAPLKAEIERLKGALKDLEDHCISEHDCDMARLPNKLSKEERQ